MEYSKGFNPHMLLFLSSPIAAGLVSFAEYFYLETPVSPCEFERAFNLNCPRGFKCEKATFVEKNPNLAAVIDLADYIVKDVAPFDLSEITASGEFFITDKKGERKNVRDKIIELRFDEEGLFCKLASGNSPLRADLFTAELESRYGISCGDIIKTCSYIGEKTVEEALEK